MVRTVRPGDVRGAARRAALPGVGRPGYWNFSPFSRIDHLTFRHLLEANNLSVQLLATINATLIAKGLMLKTGTVVDATLIAAPSSIKNSSGQRDPETHQTKGASGTSA